MNITTQLGLLTELKCQYAFSERGITLLQPIIADCRYDYVADINHNLVRIQCKTAHLDNNNNTIISILVSSKNWNTGDRHNYIGEIDYFYTYWDDKHYLIPISLVSDTQKEKRFRLGNYEDYNSQNNATYIRDYELDKILFENFNIASEILKIENSIIRKDATIRKLKEYTCIKCGAKISMNSQLCPKCAQIARRIVERPSRKELKDMIRTIPFTEIARKYNVSDKTITKWCKYENLPSRKTDIKLITDEEWNKI